MPLPWKQIHTVLLDMDGTLVDLHFNNYFWREHIPKRIAQIRSISLEDAKAFMANEYDSVAGTIDWYCFDYWQQRLKIKILEEQKKFVHLIRIRPDTIPFLDALKASGRRTVLVTNAHPKSLSLQSEKTLLGNHIEELISTHQFGITKESQELWEKLQSYLGFDPNETLFVDDSAPILQAAQQFGIANLLAISNPDSQQPNKEIAGFQNTSDLRAMIDDILDNNIQ